MIVVGITGKRGSGKTTAARGLEGFYVNSNSQVRYAHLNFADPLRQVAKTVYGLTDEEMLDSVLKEQPLDRYPFKSPREILQYIGTEMFRAYLDDTWIEAFRRRALELLAESNLYGDPFYSGVVCSDVRFPNEADAIREMGGKIIRVVNPALDRQDTASQHPSETSIDLIVPDWTIENSGSIEDLQRAVRDLVCAQ
jgi:dephospho-CoA kinase